MDIWVVYVFKIGTNDVKIDTREGKSRYEMYIYYMAQQQGPTPFPG